jgi:hypothetical protein
MAASEATVLLPTFGESALMLDLALSASAEVPVDVSVNGRFLARFEVASEPGEGRVRVPADILFRGDNVLTLRRPDGSAAPRLHRLAIRPADRTPP